MLNIEIDGKSVEVEHGSTIIDAADLIGVAIPRFCYHKKLSVAVKGTFLKLEDCGPSIGVAICINIK